MNLKKIKRAIISVSDKSNLKVVLPSLKKFNIEIISSGGSFKKIKSMKYNCIEISNYTGFNEMLNGRVKTLHPKIHGAILAKKDSKIHKSDIKKNSIGLIDLVVVNFYPFQDLLTIEPPLYQSPENNLPWNNLLSGERLLKKYFYL